MRSRTDYVRARTLEEGGGWPPQQHPQLWVAADKAHQQPACRFPFGFSPWKMNLETVPKLMALIRPGSIEVQRPVTCQLAGNERCHHTQNLSSSAVQKEYHLFIDRSLTLVVNETLELGCKLSTKINIIARPLAQAGGSFGSQ